MRCERRPAECCVDFWPLLIERPVTLLDHLVDLRLPELPTESARTGNEEQLRTFATVSANIQRATVKGRKSKLSRADLTTMLKSGLSMARSQFDLERDNGEPMAPERWRVGFPLGLSMAAIFDDSMAISNQSAIL